VVDDSTVTSRRLFRGLNQRNAGWASALIHDNKNLETMGHGTNRGGERRCPYQKLNPREYCWLGRIVSLGLLVGFVPKHRLLTAQFANPGARVWINAVTPQSPVQICRPKPKANDRQAKPETYQQQTHAKSPRSPNLVAHAARV